MLINKLKTGVNKLFMAENKKHTPEKRIDFILVAKEENMGYLQAFIENLTILGFQIEPVEGQSVNLIFLKVYMSQEAISHFADLYDIGIEDPAKGDAIYTRRVWNHPWGTPVSYIERKKKDEITNAERIMIAHTVLQKTKFGDKDSDYGLSKLMRLKIVEDAYPLHDGSLSDDEDPPHDRSLLHIYWANLGVFYKEQPLDLIKRYFGTEVAFYFAWLEYFNLMLLLPALSGLAPVIYGLLSLNYPSLDATTQIVKEVCEASDVWICPTCEFRKRCKFISLDRQCGSAKLGQIFDNYWTICFAFFMSVWAILFVKLWKRKELGLSLRWNCTFDATETEIRQQYMEEATKPIINRITGETEYYIPVKKRLIKYLISIIICILLILVVVSVVVALIPLKIWFTWKFDESSNRWFRRNSSNIIMCLIALANVTFMKIFAKLYGPASLILTTIENPKTLGEFDNSVLYKRFLLSFFNNFSQLTYLALLKGRFYTVPHETPRMLQKDFCLSLNCVPGLGIQIFFILTCKDLVGNLLSAVIPPMKRAFQRIQRRGPHLTSRVFEVPRLPQWEEEYYLEPVGRYFLLSEFMEMVIKFGQITFYAASFSLAPLCAILNNTMELRSDAFKLIRNYRRPIPLIKTGIGAWNGILLGMTYTSIAMSAFVLCFTSSHPSKLTYYIKKGTYKGYVQWIYAAYTTSSYPEFKNVKNYQKICYTRSFVSKVGPALYVRNERYWMDLIDRLGGLFVFENLVFALGALLLYFTPKHTQIVEEQLEHEEYQNKMARIEETEPADKKKSKKRKLTNVDAWINMTFNQK